MKIDRRGTGYLPPITFSAICCGLLAYAAINAPLPPVEVHHWVRVYEQVSKNEWMVDSDEPAKVALPYGRWKCCPDFDCGPYIRTGYMAYEVKYQPIRGCNSIRGSGLGWFWQPPGSKSWMNLKGEMTQ